MAMGRKNKCSGPGCDVDGYDAAKHSPTRRRIISIISIRRMTVVTPDHRIDEALKWAEVSIDQSQVAHGGETGLIAGLLRISGFGASWLRVVFWP